MTLVTIYKPPWIETIQIQDVPLKFKLDTGSETDVLPYNIYQKLSNVKLQPSHVKLRSYSGHHLSPKGQALLNVNGSDIKFQIPETVRADSDGSSPESTSQTRGSGESEVVADSCDSDCSEEFYLIEAKLKAHIYFKDVMSNVILM